MSRRRRIVLKPGSKDFERDLESRFKDVEDLLDEVSESPLLLAATVTDLKLEDGVSQDVPHGLGRKWQGWLVSNLEGCVSTGRIEHVVGEDKASYLRLKATGWGATITVSLEIY